MLVAIDVAIVAAQIAMVAGEFALFSANLGAFATRGRTVPNARSFAEGITTAQVRNALGNHRSMPG